MDTIRAILYELLPLRPSDAKKLLALAWTWIRDVFSALASGLEVLFSSAKGMGSVNAIATAAFVVGLGLCSWARVADLYLYSIVFVLLVFFGFDSRKEGEQSAYSVFNRGMKRLLGQATAEQFENEMRHVDPQLARQTAVREIDDEVRAIADAFREHQVREQERRDAEAELMRVEIAANPFRKKKGKKARRDNDRLAQKKLVRAQMDDGDDGSQDSGGGEEWEQDWAD